MTPSAPLHPATNYRRLPQRASCANCRYWFFHKRTRTFRSRPPQGPRGRTRTNQPLDHICDGWQPCPGTQDQDADHDCPPPRHPSPAGGSALSRGVQPPAFFAPDRICSTIAEIGKI